jgi:plasmid stabilization system protein ParE
MSRYALSARAKTDLQQIWNYIADDNIDAADKVRNEIRSALEKLARTPFIGHTRRDVKNPAYRFWLVYSYLIVYRPETSPLQSSE